MYTHQPNQPAQPDQVLHSTFSHVMPSMEHAGTCHGYKKEAAELPAAVEGTD